MVLFANGSQNVGLGYGVHSCLGAALARMESAIALDKLLDYMPRCELMSEGLRPVAMTNVMRMTQCAPAGAAMNVAVDAGLCEANGVCAEI